MNIKESLLREHSKSNTLVIVHYIGNDASLFKQLIALLQSDNQRLVQRASWPLSLIVENNPELVYPHLPLLLKLLDKPLHVAYKRNMFRLLRGMKAIPEKYHAQVIDLCMRAIPNINDAAAVRAFAIHVTGNLVSIYPELANELGILLEPLAGHELPSIRSSAKHVLKQIAKNLR
ncbi:MAG: hypothetical protein V4658_13010 [Bacteroidota bacterium]